MSDMLIQQDPAIASKRRLAQMLAEQSQTPIGSGSAGEAVARLVQALTGAYMDKQANDQGKADQAKSNDYVAEAQSRAGGLSNDPSGFQMSKADFSDPAFDQSKVAAMPSATNDQKRAFMISEMLKPAAPYGAQNLGAAMSKQQLLSSFVDQPPIKLGKDEVLLDPKTLKPAASNLVPDKPQKSQAMINAEAKGLKPGTPEYDKYIDSATLNNQPKVSIDQRQEGAENSAYGGELVKNYAAIRDRANASRDARNSLEMARSIKDLPGGALEPLKAKVGAVAEGLGFKPAQLQALGLDHATDAQAYTGIMQSLVLTKMQAQKGPQTENDAKRIEKTVAGLGNTPDARDFLTRAALETSNRDVLQHEFYLDWKEKKKTFDGAEKGWNKYMTNVPMVADNPTSRLPVFFTEFVEKTRSATVAAGKPEPSFEDLLDLWKQKYAAR